MHICVNPINAHADIIIQLGQRSKVCLESSSTDCAFVQALLDNVISTKIACTGSYYVLHSCLILYKEGYLGIFAHSRFQYMYNKTCLKRPLSKRPPKNFLDQLSLNAGQKYCRMLQGEHSAILSIFIKLPFVIKIFVLSFFLSGYLRQVLLYLKRDLWHHWFFLGYLFSPVIHD